VAVDDRFRHIDLVNSSRIGGMNFTLEPPIRSSSIHSDLEIPPTVQYLPPRTRTTTPGLCGPCIASTWMNEIFEEPSGESHSRYLRFPSLLYDVPWVGLRVNIKRPDYLEGSRQCLSHSPPLLNVSSLLNTTSCLSCLKFRFLDIFCLKPRLLVLSCSNSRLLDAMLLVQRKSVLSHTHNTFLPFDFRLPSLIVMLIGKQGFCRRKVGTSLMMCSVRNRRLCIHSLLSFQRNSITKGRLSRSTFLCRQPTFLRWQPTFLRRQPTFLRWQPTFLRRHPTKAALHPHLHREIDIPQTNQSYP